MDRVSVLYILQLIRDWDVLIRSFNTSASPSPLQYKTCAVDFETMQLVLIIICEGADRYIVTTYYS